MKLLFWAVLLPSIFPSGWLCAQTAGNQQQTKIYRNIVRYVEQDLEKIHKGNRRGLCGKWAKKRPSAKLYTKLLKNSPWPCNEAIVNSYGIGVGYNFRLGLPGPHDVVEDSIELANKGYEQRPVDWSVMQDLVWEEGREGTVIRVSDIYKNTVLVIPDQYSRRVNYFGNGSKRVFYIMFDGLGDITKVYEGKVHWN